MCDIRASIASCEGGGGGGAQGMLKENFNAHCWYDCDLEGGGVRFE